MAELGVFDPEFYCMTLQFNWSSSRAIFLSANILNWEWKLENAPPAIQLAFRNPSFGFLKKKKSIALKSEEEPLIHFAHSSNQLTQYSSCLTPRGSYFIQFRSFCCFPDNAKHHLLSVVPFTPLVFFYDRNIFLYPHTVRRPLCLFSWISHMWFILPFLYPRMIIAFSCSVVSNSLQPFEL